MGMEDKIKIVGYNNGYPIYEMPAKPIALGSPPKQKLELNLTLIIKK